MDGTRTNSEEPEMTDAMVRQRDQIGNATYDVCCSYPGIPDEEKEKLFPWNMQILSEVRESITNALLQFGKPVCYPWMQRSETSEILRYRRRYGFTSFHTAFLLLKGACQMNSRFCQYM